MKQRQISSWADSTDNLLYPSNFRRSVRKAPEYKDSKESNAIAINSATNNHNELQSASAPGIRHRHHHNESDVAAGVQPLEIQDGSSNKTVESNTHQNKFLVLGIDISHFSPTTQFIICASGVFGFTLVYGYLQELISVQLFNRKMGLFLAFSQFLGYSLWSTFIQIFVHKRSIGKPTNRNISSSSKGTDTILGMYVGISILRAFDLGMTNMAMQYINYPAKTLLKSSKTLWTMLFGLVVIGKRYKQHDYAAVILMVMGLAIFLHADATSSAVFQPMGILMLVGSLVSDGAISNLSETLMSKYSICQDEYIFYIYSFSTIAIFMAAMLKGDIALGIQFLSVPGTMEELELGQAATWSIANKIIVITLFSTFGFFGSSCSAAITKNFGALTMSITSTARKAATLFISFIVFPNKCTIEHVLGIILFLFSLFMKAMVGSKNKGRKTASISRRHTVHIV